ncbi:sugar ABC transporter permease, partial [Schumannella luteola]
MTQLGLQRTPARRIQVPRPTRPRGDGRVALFFIAPVLLGFAIFYLYPTIRGFWWSFTDYSLLADPEFVGIDNYVA